MKQLAWGDILAGFPVTPESWLGGIVDVQGEWLASEWIGEVGGEGCCKHPNCGSAAMPCDPIYPPIGWNGLDEGVIWGAFCAPGKSYGGVLLHQQAFIDVWVNKYSMDSLVDMRAGMGGYEGTIEEQSIEDLPALIRALSNAQVMSERLQYGKINP